VTLPFILSGPEFRPIFYRQKGSKINRIKNGRISDVNSNHFLTNCTPILSPIPDKNINKVIVNCPDTNKIGIQAGDFYGSECSSWVKTCGAF
jgi:hypothetical protein